MHPIIIKYNPDLSIVGFKLQAVFTTLIMLSVFLFILAINPMSLRAEGQLSLSGEKELFDNSVFFLLDEGEYT